ncbi:MAG: nucleotidyltransferase domain-containing protein [Treponema sp.]|jgi:predicted nucleotidyltransferase|nr:nucleotidyltransferase domain-containing protein [Treponema sp.]
MAVSEEIQNIAQSILGSVDAEAIYLFGSYAYGTPTKDSDYDFYVLIKDDSPIKPIDVMEKIYCNFNSYGKSVDILANYKTRFKERSAFATLERKIVREGVLLYERP